MTAPFYSALTSGLGEMFSEWVHCDDGTRLRMVGWKSGTKGTVLIFQGRTEFIEKYDHVAVKFAELGYSVATLDWRGQGLSDRQGVRRNIGHVDDFAQYQNDVSAFETFLDRHQFPATRTLLCHSMGGAIGLRALHNGLEVEQAIFSAPMWGIFFTPVMKKLVPTIARVLPMVGRANSLAPTTTYANYALEHPFEDNTLTNDRSAYEELQTWLRNHPDLELGGPSVHWLGNALKETQKLRELPPPAIPCLCFLGTNERIVDGEAVKTLMDQWQNGELVIFPEAQHEVLLEVAQVRTEIWHRIQQVLPG